MTLRCAGTLRSFLSVRTHRPRGSLAPRTPRTSRETNTSRQADSLALRSLRSLREYNATVRPSGRWATAPETTHIFFSKLQLYPMERV